MLYRILYTQKAKNDLSSLNKQISIRILNKLDYFVNSGKPLQFAKKLVDNQINVYRFRVGDFRIFFDLGSDNQIIILLILRIKHRKDVYK